MIDWWNAPVDEFVRIPWNSVTEGCHIMDKKVVCYNYLPTNAFYRSIDLPVTIHPDNNEPMWVIAGLIFLLIICMTVWLEDKGYFGRTETWQHL